MLSHPMTRRPPCAADRRASLAALAARVAACGEEGIDVAQTTAARRRAEIFDERCSGCHTLDVGGHRGLGDQRAHPRVQGRPELQPAQGDRTNACCTRSATAASPRARCRRTSSPAQEAEELARVRRGELGQATSRRARAERPAGTDCPRRGVARDARPRAIRRDPEPVRAALARRRDGSDERLDAALELRRAPERAAARASRRLRRERNAGAKAIGEAKRAGADACGGDRRDAGGQRAGQGARAGAGARRGGARRRCRPRCRTRPTRPPPTRTPSLREVGERGPTGRDHLELAGRADRHGGRREGRRLALRLPEGRPRAARAGARALGAGGAARPRLRAGRPARAGARGGAVRHRLPARTPSSRSTAWPTTRCTSPARPRCRWPRCTRARSSTRAAAALRRLLAVLPARGGRRGHATRAASSACTSSTRSRCSLRRARGVARPSTSGCWRSRRRSCRRSRSRTAWSTSRSTTSAPRRPRSTTRGVAARASGATASSPRPRTRPTSRRAGWTSATGPRAGGPEHVHTLNGTAVAVGRTLIALMENHQDRTGWWQIPDVRGQWGALGDLRTGGEVDRARVPVVRDGRGLAPALAARRPS